MLRLHPLLVLVLVTLSLIASSASRSTHAANSVVAPNVSSTTSFERVSPRTVGTIGGIVNAVTVKGNYAYISQGNALRVLDVSNPAMPKEVSSITLPTIGTKLTVAGNLLFMTGDGDVWIIDIGNPTKPALRSVYSSRGDVYALHVVGDLAYLADQEFGVQIVSLGNPGQLLLLGSYDTPGQARAVYVVDGLAYVADEAAGLHMIDVRNPAQPALRASIPILGNAVDVQVANNIAYVAVGATSRGSGGLYLIDIANPAAPKVRGVYNLAPIGGALSVQVVGTIAYADVQGVINIIDISNPDAPARLYVYGGGGRFQAENNILYIAGLQGYGLSTWDVRAPSNPIGLASFETPALPVDVQVVSALAYVADIGGSFWTIDVRVPSKPKVVGRHRFTYGAYDVETEGTVAYVIADDKLNIFNISDPTNLVLLDTYPVAGRAHNLAVEGGAAYISVGYTGLQILDVRDPTNISEYTRYTAPDEVKHVQVVAGRAYIAAGLGGLQILDVANPSAPQLLGAYTYPNQYIQDVEIVGSRALVVVDGVGLQILDISRPQSPMFLGQYNGDGKLSVVDNLAYLANFNRIEIVDLSNSAMPTRRGSYNGAGYADTAFGADGLVYIAAESRGIHILELTMMTHGSFLPIVGR